jgi:ketosteroid isomerase-like protein
MLGMAHKPERDTARAMSQENVELVRSVMTRFTETQEPSDRLTPDFVWDLRSWPPWTGQKEYHGADGFRQFFAEWINAYEEWTQELEDFIDAGDSQVAVTSVQRGRMRGSDSWVDLRATFLYTIEGELISRIEVYESPEQALHAAG